MERFEVLELACDPPGWHAEIDGWRDTYGDVVVEFATNVRARMAPACDRLRVAVLEGDAAHDGDPVLARHVGHFITKETDARKIDAAVAGVVAFERAAWHRANVREVEPMVAWA